MEHSMGIRQPVRVLLIDDSILTLHGLKTFLSKSSHIDIVGVARTRAEALAAIQAHRPNVVVLEVRVGQASGIDLCRTIRESRPNIGILFFTAHDDKDLLHSAILAGAQGYLLKNAAAEAVARSIEIVATGEAIIDHRLTHLVITWLRDGDEAEQEGTKGSCSKDDLRLLFLVASGKTNKEIVQELNVPPSIVAARLQRIYKHLRISRRSEAVRYYVHLERPHMGLKAFLTKKAGPSDRW
ncbi:MAG TPA: response regulator transcription factor [Nitrospira sp.]|nr:response regulator transcription factor [Nitrospira sp.]